MVQLICAIAYVLPYSQGGQSVVYQIAVHPANRIPVCHICCFFFWNMVQVHMLSVSQFGGDNKGCIWCALLQRFKDSKLKVCVHFACISSILIFPFVYCAISTVFWDHQF